MYCERWFICINFLSGVSLYAPPFIYKIYLFFAICKTKLYTEIGTKRAVDCKNKKPRT